jgi:hypothetical protein
VLDRGPRELRGSLYAVCGVLVIAGIGVPAGTSSFRSDVNDVFDGIQSGLDDAANNDDVITATTVDPTIPSYEIESAVEDQLSSEHDIDALVTCDNDLNRRTGASEVCTFETFASDDVYNVTVTVRSVDGEDVEYTVAPSSQPN